MLILLPVIVGINAAVVAIAFHVSIESGAIFSRYGDWVYRIPQRIGKPLGRCFKCMSGQIGFWAGILTAYQFPDAGNMVRCSFILLCPCWAIFFAIFFGRAVPK